MEETNLLVVYISTSVEDYNNAIHMANVLWDDGFVAYVPQIYYHKNLSSSSSISSRLKQNLTILNKCDLVLRLKGESEEGNAEVAYANENNIPVFDDYRKLMVYIREGLDG